MKTVQSTILHNIWGGKVIVEELKSFNDPRGVVAELWRADDDGTIDEIINGVLRR